MKVTMKVKGMHCRSCEVLLLDVLEELGAKPVSGDYKKGIVTADFASAPDREKIRQAFQKEGYNVEGFS